MGKHLFCTLSNVIISYDYIDEEDALQIWVDMGGCMADCTLHMDGNQVVLHRDKRFTMTDFAHLQEGDKDTVDENDFINVAFDENDELVIVKLN